MTAKEEIDRMWRERLDKDSKSHNTDSGMEIRSLELLVYALIDYVNELKFKKENQSGK